MRHSRGTDQRSLIDILDRVLDKGIVIDATVRLSVIGIDVVGVDAQITVASVQTYLQLCEDPRAYEFGLLPGEPPPHSLPKPVDLVAESDAAVGRGKEVEPVQAGASLGGAVPAGDPEELGRAAFHEEPSEEEGV